MNVRRVVTGHGPDGMAIFASDSMVEGRTVRLIPGLEIHNIWGADEPPTFPDDGSKPAVSTYFPSLHGFRFGLVTIPPESVQPAKDLDTQAALAEMESKLPGLASHIEPDHPGMHRSETVDYEYVISGEVWLELDDCEQVLLRPGDTVVQNGTRHAWRNEGTIPCIMIFCLLGAKSRAV